MNLTIKLPDEDVPALTAKATARGISAEQYALQVLEQDLAPEWLRKSWTSAKETGLDQLSPDEIDAEIAAARKARRSPRLIRRDSANQLEYSRRVNLGESMTITLDIRPEVQAELARQAAAQGCPIEAIAATLLEEAVHLPTSAASRAPAKNLVELSEPIRGLLTDEEIDVIFSRNPSTSRPIDLS